MIAISAPINEQRGGRSHVYQHGKSALIQIIVPVHSHRALGLAITSEGSAGKHSDFLKRPIVQVVIEIVGTGIVGNVQVGPTVVVVVAPDYTETVVAA